MFGIGPLEFVIFLVIVLVAVGPEKLPTFMRTVGRGVREVRRAAREFRDATGIDDLMRDDPPKPKPRAPKEEPVPAEPKDPDSADQTQAIDLSDADEVKPPEESGTVRPSATPPAIPEAVRASSAPEAGPEGATTDALAGTDDSADAATGAAAVTGTDAATADAATGTSTATDAETNDSDTSAKAS